MFPSRVANWFNILSVFTENCVLENSSISGKLRQSAVLLAGNKGLHKFIHQIPMFIIVHVTELFRCQFSFGTCGTEHRYSFAQMNIPKSIMKIQAEQCHSQNSKAVLVSTVQLLFLASQDEFSREAVVRSGSPWRISGIEQEGFLKVDADCKRSR